MIGWIDFFILMFWFSLGLFFFNTQNFVSILLYAELTWLILYVLSILVGSQINDIISMSFTFFILGFGGLEFVIGLMLVVLMKNFNIGLTNDSTDKNLNTLSNLNSTGNLNSKKWNI